MRESALLTLELSWRGVNTLHLHSMRLHVSVPEPLLKPDMNSEAPFVYQNQRSRKDDTSIIFCQDKLNRQKYVLVTLPPDDPDNRNQYYSLTLMASSSGNRSLIGEGTFPDGLCLPLRQFYWHCPKLCRSSLISSWILPSRYRSGT